MITMLCVLENYHQHLELSPGIQQNSFNENGCLTPLKLYQFCGEPHFLKKDTLYL